MEDFAEPLLYRWQHRARPPTDYESRLADELMATFAAGVHDLPGIARRLNESGLAGPGGGPWTAEAFSAAVRDLASP